VDSSEVTDVQKANTECKDNERLTLRRSTRHLMLPFERGISAPIRANKAKPQPHSLGFVETGHSQGLIKRVVAKVFNWNHPCTESDCGNSL
jgi:hypothetical protein